MTTLIFVFAAYLIGCVPFALVSSKLFGLADPRSYGSGNPGATNVLRSGNKGAALVTLLGDGAKGWLAVWLAARFAPGYGLDGQVVALAAVAVFLGHVFPVSLGFKGGKGVATAAGVMLALSPAIFGVVALVWFVVALVSRYSSLAALLAAAAAPLAALSYLDNGWGVLAVIVNSLLLTWRHQANIKKLIAGTESKIGKKQ